MKLAICEVNVVVELPDGTDLENVKIDIGAPETFVVMDASSDPPVPIKGARATMYEPTQCVAMD